MTNAFDRLAAEMLRRSDARQVRLMRQIEWTVGITVVASISAVLLFIIALLLVVVA